MSPSKLAWHFQSVPGWAARVVNSDWVKIIDPPSSNPFPAQRTIGRTYVPDNESNAMVLRGAAGADDWYNRVRPVYERAPWVWCWEAPNEPAVQTPAQRAALVAFTRRWVELMHAAGRKTVALCLGVGWPDIGQAPDLAGALEATDYWAVHEYSAPTLQNQETLLCLRYRRTVQELTAAGARVPSLLITECGIDGGVIGQDKKGWKSFTDAAGYLNQLEWYDGELQRDDYVQAATIFTSGPAGDWANFDVDENLSRNMAGYIQQQRQQQQRQQQPPPPPPPPLPPPPAPPSVSGFALQRPLPAGAGYVSQWFGETANDYSEPNLAGHNGLDYVAAAGTPVLAAHAGRCTTGSDAGYGNWVQVTALDGSFLTLYAHLQSVSVSDGQQVNARDTIGLLGNTGRSSGPHLHFGWKVAGVRNPAYWDWIDPYLGRKLNGDA